MKNFFYIILFTFASLINVQAQDAIEKKSSMSLGAQNGFFVEIQGADAKMSEKTFYEIMKDYGKLKENKKAKEHYLMASKIAPINGSSPVDLYVKFEEGKGMATTFVWVDLGGAFVNSNDHASQTTAMRQFLYDYFIAVRKKVVMNEIKAQEDKLKDLEKDLKKLKEKNTDFHSDIEKAKQKIAEAEKNIEKNIVDQENKVKEIDTQKSEVEKVTEKLNNLGKKD